MSVSFLEVGHGDSIVIIYPDGITASVVDTPNSKITFDYLIENRVRHIDWIIISHGDMDHYKGISSLINNLINQGISISNLGYIRGDKNVKNEKGYNKLRRQFVVFEDIHGISTRAPYGNAGSILRNVDGMLIQSIYPYSPADVDYAKDEANDWSIVLMIEYYGRKVLLPGDLEGKGWFRLVKRCQKNKIDLHSDVFKLPHHGSWFSGGHESLSLGDVISLVNASVGVISLGQSERFVFPSIKTIKALSQSPANPRILCTGVGNSCHKGGIIETVPGSIKLGKSRYANCNPCAGNILVELTDTDLMIKPTEVDHDVIKSQLTNPLCCIHKE